MKDRTFFNWLIIFLGVVAIMGFSFTPAFADDADDTMYPNGALIQSEDDFNGVEPLEDPELLDESFGQNYQYTWIPWSSFVPGSSGPSYTRSGAWYWCTGGSDCVFVAGMNLPSGAKLNAIQLYYYDNSASSVFMLVTRNTWTTGSTTLASIGSSGSPGYGVLSVFPNHRIRNGDGQYTVYVNLSSGGSNTRFHGVRLHWRREISPAPATSSFNDVSTSAWYFQGVEALANSGITVGCGGGNFCPNVAVTRAQMAVFLARALGLHWTYPY